MLQKVEIQNSIINSVLGKQLPKILLEQEPDDLDEFENQIFSMVDVLSYY